jgi:sporulation protein YlmC with PRC-barrel domain
MLIDAKTIEGFKIHATDGVIGEVHDIWFDDAAWTVRYFVVNTGTWFSREQVLLSPESVTEIDWADRSLAVALKCQQVKDSPDLGSIKTVSRQEEARLRDYYAWPVYWSATGLGDGLGGPISPVGLPDAALWTTRATEGVQSITNNESVPPSLGAVNAEPVGDPHLRSVREVRNYAISATDGEIGHVEDLVVDDEHWTINQLVVDTKNWWPGRKVTVSPDHIREVRWADRTVTVNLTRRKIKHAPEPVLEHK